VVTTDFGKLLGVLADGEVEFVVIGAVALVVHGSARVTRDLDVCYSRAAENLERLSAALLPLAPALRGAPPGLWFTLDARTLQSGLNFTLTTTAGDIDLLGEVTGLGGYTTVRRLSAATPLYNRSIQVLSLDGLERAKRAAGRLKDLADLEEILELRRLGGG
jgi:hypothetical protein